VGNKGSTIFDRSHFPRGAPETDLDPSSPTSELKDATLVANSVQNKHNTTRTIEDTEKILKLAMFALFVLTKMVKCVFFSEEIARMNRGFQPCSLVPLTKHPRESYQCTHTHCFLKKSEQHCCAANKHSKD
jgi:hypothetical protein